MLIWSIYVVLYVVMTFFVLAFYFFYFVNFSVDI